MIPRLLLIIIYPSHCLRDSDQFAHQVLINLLALFRPVTTGGDIVVENVLTEHQKPLIAKLREAGVTVEEDVDRVRVVGGEKLKAIDIKTLPYPGFPTDMQAQMMAMMAIAEGRSKVTETVFENRFMHVVELNRMGASITAEGRSAVVDGPAKLTGCQVRATDLRAGAAMILAGLVAEGTTEICDIYHIDRGYEEIVAKLQGLGADIKRVGGNDICQQQRLV